MSRSTAAFSLWAKIQPAPDPALRNAYPSLVQSVKSVKVVYSPAAPLFLLRLSMNVTGKHTAATIAM
jgi:hypothetical protein